MWRKHNAKCFFFRKKQAYDFFKNEINLLEFWLSSLYEKEKIKLVNNLKIKTSLIVKTVDKNKLNKLNRIAIVKLNRILELKKLIKQYI